MTTNQTIDGVPREQMISFPRELSDDLGELIANKARVCGGGAFEIWEAICEQFGTPAAQPQGEPVAVVNSVISRKNKLFEIEVLGSHGLHIGIKLYAEQPAPVAVVLTDEQILESMRRPMSDADGGYVVDTAPEKVIEAGRALIDEITRLNTK